MGFIKVTIVIHWFMKQEWIWNKAQLRRKHLKISFVYILDRSSACYLSAEKTHLGETIYLQ